MQPNQIFLIVSRILKTDFGAPTNIRFHDFPRQRRSSVLRRVRDRSAIIMLLLEYAKIERVE